MNKNNIILRKEIVSDYRIVEELTREAFWNHHVPGCDEHYLLHIMRQDASFISELDIVAEIEGKIVGNIVYTRGKIIEDSGNIRDVISFGPISVLPDFQNKGIGRKLIEYTKRSAINLGYSAVLIYGDPEYYKKFGFYSAEKYNIRTADNMYAEALLAMELISGELSNISGRFIEDEIYAIDQKKAAEFDKSFPVKEKLENLQSQKRFLQLLKSVKPCD